MNVDIERRTWGVAEVFFVRSFYLWRYDRFFGLYDAEWSYFSYKKKR